MPLANRRPGPTSEGCRLVTVGVNVCDVMVATGPGSFSYVVAFALLVLDVWAAVLVIRTGSRYLDRTRPPRPPRPERPPLFPKGEPPASP